MILKTCAVFRSTAFNTTNSKPEYVHQGNCGDDVVLWLADKLRDRGTWIEEEEPSQEDHGWYLTFRRNDILYDLIVSYAPENGGAPRWLVSIERGFGLLGSLFGRRYKRVEVEVVRLVNDILQKAEECRGVRWLFETDLGRGDLQHGSEDPFAA